MKYAFILLIFCCCFSCKNAPTEATVSEITPTTVAPQKRAAYAMAIHGGAGTILKENMTPEKEAAFKAKLNEALDAGVILFCA